MHGAGPESYLSTDSRWLLYTRLDDIGRSHQLRAHRIGDAGAEDVLLLEEPDQWASVEISRSRDASTLVVRSTAPRTATTWMLSLDDPTAPPRRVTTGRGRSRCQVEHAGDRLLVIPQDPTARMLLGEAPLDWTGDASESPRSSRRGRARARDPSSPSRPRPSRASSRSRCAPTVFPGCGSSLDGRTAASMSAPCAGSATAARSMPSASTSIPPGPRPPSVIAWRA